MKDKNEFLKQMENLKVPDIDPAMHPERVKMAIMNAERSAVLGVWLIVVPCYFLLCVFMYYLFHVRGSWFGAMFTLLSGLNKTPYIDFMGPLVLVLLPIICIVINALAIVHVGVRKPIPGQKVKEFNVTVKVKLWNILLILLSLAVVFAFLTYVMAQSISIKN
jgi:hypothetical protein